MPVLQVAGQTRLPPSSAASSCQQGQGKPEQSVAEPERDRAILERDKALKDRETTEAKVADLAQNLKQLQMQVARALAPGRTCLL